MECENREEENWDYYCIEHDITKPSHSCLRWCQDGHLVPPEEKEEFEKKILLWESFWIGAWLAAGIVGLNCALTPLIASCLLRQYGARADAEMSGKFTRQVWVPPSTHTDGNGNTTTTPGHHETHYYITFNFDVENEHRHCNVRVEEMEVSAGFHGMVNEGTTEEIVHLQSEPERFEFERVHHCDLCCFAIFFLIFCSCGCFSTIAALLHFYHKSQPHRETDMGTFFKGLGMFLLGVVALLLPLKLLNMLCIKHKACKCHTCPGLLSIKHPIGAEKVDIIEYDESGKLMMDEVTEVTMRSRNDPVPANDFIAAATFTSSKPGWSFKMGPNGLGYYRDRTLGEDSESHSEGEEEYEEEGTTLTHQYSR
eukprot:gnl/MRDRNA2_/MRDRNA2_201877_c0_seq1.p1 gnl/MRDRNA2_/MRDRNA2_201877_c0~~gnl/MRDRNA2_/MRDRNA2_201877_c0_seq1.p1  ORF type:complete len:420 (+),score=59.67 gnl/MRDRNA2_/MRDRNA2_201877_c0_seq1:160-1260(+)